MRPRLPMPSRPSCVGKRGVDSLRRLLLAFRSDPLGLASLPAWRLSMQRRRSNGKKRPPCHHPELPFAGGAVDRSPAMRVEAHGGTTFRVAALFAGVGGLERGLGLAGHSTELLCEIDAYARAVLEHRFPDVSLHDDVRTLSGLPERADLLTAGFPCQDLSQAGMTKGITGDKSGLVQEVFRLIRSSRIENVLLENVPFMLRLGGGAAMDVLVRSFEELGYRWAYRVLDSRAFGLAQRRQRVFFFATRTMDPRDVLLAADTEDPNLDSDRTWRRDVPCSFYWTEGVRGLGWAVDATPTLKGGSTIGIPSPPAVLWPDGLVFQPDIRDAEALQGFPRGWTKPAESVGKPGHRWKLVGNAVSVPVAKWIGERLTRPEIYDSSRDEILSPGSAWPSAAWNVGRGRFSSDSSAWPVRKPFTLKGSIRHEGTPLSLRATSGFLKRLELGYLRLPPGFVEAIRAHQDRMSQPQPA